MNVVVHDAEVLDLEAVLPFGLLEDFQEEFFVLGGDKNPFSPVDPGGYVVFGAGPKFSVLSHNGIYGVEMEGASIGGGGVRGFFVEKFRRKALSL
jgi:hypothetical protein